MLKQQTKEMHILIHQSEKPERGLHDTFFFHRKKMPGADLW